MITSIIKQKYLTERQLCNKKKCGTHKVQKQIVGYKRIECECISTNFFAWLNNEKHSTKTIKVNAIAELEIPINATIIRPLITTESFCVDSFVSPGLRTDKAIVKKIKPTNPLNFKFDSSNCKCYSLYNNDYEYSINKEQKPTKEFDDDIYNYSTSGIHFFLSKSDVRNYF